MKTTTDPSTGGEGGPRSVEGEPQDKDAGTSKAAGKRKAQPSDAAPKKKKKKEKVKVLNLGASLRELSSRDASKGMYRTIKFLYLSLF